MRAKPFRFPKLLTLTACIGLAATMAAGCAEGAPSTTVRVADSAGVTVHTYPPGILDEVPTVRLGERVDTVGELMGAPEHQFTTIVGAAVFPFGFAVADDGAAAVRLYDYEGRLVDSYGRRGSGPDEFERLSWIAQSGDSLIFAWDSELGRLTTVHASAEGLRGGEVRSSDVAPWQSMSVGVFADGRLLRSPLPPTPPPEPGEVTPSIVQFAIPPIEASGEPVTVSAPGRPVYLDRQGHILPVPFTTMPSYAADQEGLWLGSGSTDEIRRYDRSGSLVRILRLPAGPAVDEGLRSRFESHHLEGVREEARPATRALLAEVPYPPALPAYERIVLDRDGNLWVRPFSTDDQDRVRWVIFTPDGDVRGSVELPSDLRVLAVGHGRVIGRDRDDLGVQRVLIRAFD